MKLRNKIIFRIYCFIYAWVQLIDSIIGVMTFGFHQSNLAAEVAYKYTGYEEE